MYKLKVNKNGDGIQFVLGEDEFNAWIYQIDDVLSRIVSLKDDAAKKDSKALKKVRTQLMTKSAFDKKTREAYCLLPVFDFEILVHFLAFDLPGAAEDKRSTPFKQALSNPLSKRR